MSCRFNDYHTVELFSAELYPIFKEAAQLSVLVETKTVDKIIFVFEPRGELFIFYLFLLIQNNSVM